MDFESSALLLAWLAITTLAFGMAGLLRQLALLRAGPLPGGARVGPSPGAPAPEIPGIEYAGRRTCLLFAGSDCPSCHSIIESLSEAGGDSGAEVVVLFSGGANGSEFPPERLFVQQDELFRRLGVSVTPFGVLVDGDGRIVAAEPVGSVEMFNELRARGTRMETPQHDPS